MSKKNQNTAEQIVTETTVVETTAPVTEAVVSTPIPMDGSGAEQYIKDAGGVSKAIRLLTDAGHKRGAVAKMLNKRYQHVRNVLITPIKKTT